MKTATGQPLLPDLSDERLRVAGDRLLDPKPFASRARGVRERLSDRIEQGSRHVHRQARRQAQRIDDSRQQPRPDAEREGPEGRRERARRQMRCRRRPGIRRPAPSSRWRRRRPTTQISSRSRTATRRSSRRSRKPAPTHRHCSTGQPRGSIRRARRSRRSPRRPRSTTASTPRSRRSSTPATAPSTASGCTTPMTRPAATRPTARSPSHEAYQHSINAVFCNIGQKLASARILDEAKKFGFYTVPPLETPSDARSASGLYKGSKLYDPKDPDRFVDPGRLAFGQEKMLVTPLQMAMVAGAVANGGVMMKPYAGEESDLAEAARSIERTQPHVLRTADEAEDGRRAQPDDGLRRHGRHRHRGTDPRRRGRRQDRAPQRRACTDVYDAWFIFFAPAEDPTVAGAVVVQDVSRTASAARSPRRSRKRSCRRSCQRRRTRTRRATPAKP